MHASDNVQLGASGGISYDGKIAGLYDLEETLGSGHFAVVKLARHVFTGAKVAVKVVDKTKLDEVSKAHLFQEVRCMKLVQHPNVVRLYEVIDTQTKLYLVLEFGDGGDLYDYIMRHEGGLSEELAKKYFRQIVRAISYCHQLHVVHRDLKPENVVFFEKLGVVKITDFGFSNKFSPGQKLETSCGSLAYSAPEILLGDSYDAPAVDVWSLGVILYMLVCGQPPFEKANDSETLTMIMDCKYTVPWHITPACRNLIASMLVRDPEKRSSLNQIAENPWLQENKEEDVVDNLPLVSKQELNEEDHAFIIQKMINGKISTKEEIIQSLDKNKYNHITATYFLLGELRLRKRREEEMQRRHPQQLTCDATAARPKSASRVLASDKKLLLNENNRLTVPINIEECTPSVLAGDSIQDKRSRKCSIVREEDEDESAYEYLTDKCELKVAITRRESISDGRLNKSIQERTNTIVPAVVPTKPNPKSPFTLDASLVRKLDQIENNDGNVIVNKTQSAECKSVDGSSKYTSTKDELGDIKDLRIKKLKHLSATNKSAVLTHRKLKMNKIRTPSCSSSEASDEDTKTRNKKKINKFVGDTPVRFRMHRRDSHDDSSDSQDQTTFPSSGSYAHKGNIIASSTSNSNDKRDEQHRKNGKTRSEETQKSYSKQKKTTNAAESDDNTCGHVRKLNALFRMRRPHIRESQSLDRITEAQEYEQRFRHSTGTRLYACKDTNAEQRNSLENLNSLSLVETKEEYDEDINVAGREFQLAPPRKENSIEVKRNNKISKLISIEDIDLIIDVNNLTKAIQVTGSRCSVTMKKIRRLGKYFPVVNF